ncbi:MAG: hypothetical protein HRU15_18760, partial [Planctomycetes bacterium]|nr:hypothetical protein [Planctomycetota bacterium]
EQLSEINRALSVYEQGAVAGVIENLDLSALYYLDLGAQCLTADWTYDLQQDGFLTSAKNITPALQLTALVRCRAWELYHQGNYRAASLRLLHALKFANHLQQSPLEIEYLTAVRIAREILMDLNAQIMAMDELSRIRFGKYCVQPLQLMQLRDVRILEGVHESLLWFENHMQKPMDRELQKLMFKVFSNVRSNITTSDSSDVLKNPITEVYTFVSKLEKNRSRIQSDFQQCHAYVDRLQLIIQITDPQTLMHELQLCENDMAAEDNMFLRYCILPPNALFIEGVRLQVAVNITTEVVQNPNINHRILEKRFPGYGQMYVRHSAKTLRVRSAPEWDPDLLHLTFPSSVGELE